MQYQGVLKKMTTEFNTEIQYYLDMENDFLNLNQLLQKEVTITFKKFECLNCGANKKIYRQGFCYDCFYKIPQAADWIMKPELSKAHLDIEDRDLAYEKKSQLQPHIVYLALSSDIKVGVTRKTQIPTRWIDQGASKAIPILEVPNRYLAGIAEVALKDKYVDKTNWRKMLKNEIIEADLAAEIPKIKEALPEEVKPFFSEEAQEVISLNFPVEKYPEKVKSLNLEKTPSYTGKLMGVKGQYLIFEDETVFNVRSNEGNVVEIVVK